MPWIVEMSFWFFGIGIIFLLLTFSPTIAHAVKKSHTLGNHRTWSDEKLDARETYLLFNESLSGSAELEAIHEIQEERRTQRMRQYGKDKWNEWKDES